MRQKPLKGGGPLRAKQGLGRAPKTKNTISSLKKDARKWFNKAVKYRDSILASNGNVLFRCITCNAWVLFRDSQGRFYRGAQAGHFMPETRNNTRFNEMNVNGQCQRCNYEGLGEQYKYAAAIDKKYGDGIANNLYELSRVSHQFTEEELLEIIRYAKEEVRTYEDTYFPI